MLAKIFDRLMQVRLSWFMAVFLLCAAVIASLPFLEGKRKNENFLILSYLLHEYKTELSKDYKFTRLVEFEGRKHFISVKYDRKMKIEEVIFTLKENPNRIYSYNQKQMNEEKLANLLHKNEAKFVAKLDHYYFAPEKVIQVALSEDSSILKIEEVLGEEVDQRNAFYFNSIGKLVNTYGANGLDLEIVYSKDYQKIAKIQRPKHS